MSENSLERGETCGERNELHCRSVDVRSIHVANRSIRSGHDRTAAHDNGAVESLPLPVWIEDLFAIASWNRWTVPCCGGCCDVTARVQGEFSLISASAQAVCAESHRFRNVVESLYGAVFD